MFSTYMSPPSFSLSPFQLLVLIFFYPFWLLPLCLSPNPPFCHLLFKYIFLFLNFSVEFANSTRSPLTTSNPKTRWDFFTPPGKLLRSSQSSCFHPQVLNAVSLLILQALVSPPLVPTLVFPLTLCSARNETHLTPQRVCVILQMTYLTTNCPYVCFGWFCIAGFIPGAVP